MLWSLWISVAGLVASSHPANDVDRFLSDYYEVYRSGTAEELAAFYADDVVFDDVSQRHHVEGRVSFTEALRGLKNIHVEMSVEEKRRVVSGDSVVVEVLYKGTFDCAKLGRPDHENLSYTLPAVLLFEVSNGRVRRQTDYIDYRARGTILDRAKRVRSLTVRDGSRALSSRSSCLCQEAWPRMGCSR